MTSARMTPWCLHTGKVITKHEDHILWVESLMLRNLGPISRLYDSAIRRYIGIFFCWLGNTIYETLSTLSEAVSGLFHNQV